MKAFEGSEAGVTDPTPAPTVRHILAEFAAFLRAPAILDPQGWRNGGMQRWAVLTFLLIFGLLAVLLPFLGLWHKLMGTPAPTAFDNFPREWLVPVTVIVAPVAEELLFRGWQRGSAGALWLLACAAAAGLVLMQPAALANVVLAGGVILAAMVAAPVGWALLRKRPAPLGWFARAFAWIFYGVAIGFALFHLTNYPTFGLAMLPLVLPQLWAALVLGYLRQKLGLAQAILAHMLANGSSIGLALMSGTVGG
ncbi:CAAX prenyl protease-like protein [Novosphingobium kunmingense]|uniref:CAAX prenyl protease-like protein n=1 Tax=Novosphingobium kunmingense TaxID=1211806 RepID=A0A2N0H7B3_9SPHN|nr:CPBP family glutamic-type intramembrane protease [Novosphingobium kunmingense]PKB14832.1 CAAX prenyl protease-like protein [Novosphingobium kunmingense]